MEDDWDLQAVVRGCSAGSATTSSSAATTISSCGHQPLSNLHQDYDFSNICSFQDLFEPRRDSFVQELHDLYKPFFPNPQPQPQPQPSQTTPLSPQSCIPISPLSVLGGLQDPSSEPQIANQLPLQTQFREKQPYFSVSNAPKASSTHQRSKRRKNHMKRVCHVAAENLSSDMWSWRKYGQKPIKGSPYPRGYYRCSTSKGCMARKQVERNRSDPGMFIVTYTAEHNHPMPTHRNSLAGSTRHKPAESPTSDNKPTTSPAMSPAASLSPAPEKPESSRDDLVEAEDEDDEFCVSKIELEDDFFAGLEDFASPATGECFSDHLQFPWLATTTAAGGS